MAVRGESTYANGIRQIKTDVKTGTFRPCYLIYGPEDYLVSEGLKTLKGAFSDPAGGMNRLVKKGEEIDAEEAVSFARTMPFLADRRIVILEDDNRFQKSAKELCEYVKDPSDTAVMILVARGFSAQEKRTLSEFQSGALAKACEKHGRVLYCELQSAQTIKSWVVKKLGVDGRKSFQESTIAYFLDRMNGNMRHIETEVNKLLSYTEGQDEITKKDIDAICTPWTEGRIYELTEALSKRDRQSAMTQYLTLLEMEETPQRILYQIGQQIHGMMMVQEMDRAHFGKEAMVKALDLKPNRAFLVGKYLSWSRNFKDAELRSIFEMILNLDRQVKRSLLDKSIAVEMVIARCTA